MELVINNPELKESLPEGKKTTEVMPNPWPQLECKLPLLSAVNINIWKSRVQVYLLQCCEARRLGWLVVSALKGTSALLGDAQLHFTGYFWFGT